MTGNKGEWSELYVFMKLLSEGRLYAADENIEKISSIYYDIIKIIRSQTDGKWEYLREGSINIIKAETNEIMLSVPLEKFKLYSDKLLEELQSSKHSSGAFEIPEIWEFAKNIKCNTLKAKAIDKSDISIMVHDSNNGSEPIFGFSIKSQLGSPSTLLNASKATNFLFKIANYTLNMDEIEKFNSLSNFKDKTDFLNNLNAEIIFDTIENDAFDYNLRLIDSQMPEIIGSLIKAFYSKKGTKISDLMEEVVKQNPLFIDGGSAIDFYSYKIKEMLTNIALGMVPSSKWDGKYDATGGYLIVKDDGEVLCYHIYNRNDFREYLYKNTKLETPSTTRHNFGNIINTPEGQFINLNLQIRFIN